MEKEYRGGITLNYIMIIFTIVSSFFVTPWLIKSLGDINYGIYMLVFSTISFFAVGDFVIGIVVVRYISKFLALNDTEKVENYLYMISFVYLALIAIVFVICFVIISFAGAIFVKLTPPEITLFKNMFWIMTCNTIFLLIQNFLFAIITGYEKIVFTRVFSIAKVILKTAGIAAVAYMGLGGVMAFSVELSLTVLTVLAYFLYARKIGARIKKHELDRTLLIKNIKNMAFIFITHVSETSFWNAASAVIAIKIGASSVGIFTIAITFATIYIQLGSTISQYMLSKFTVMIAKKTKEKELDAFVVSVGKEQAALLGIATVGFILFGKQFLDMWIGESFRESYYIAMLVLTALFIPQTAAVLETLLQSVNKFEWRLIFTAASTVFNVILMWFFIDLYGIVGTAFSIIISMIVFRTICMGIYMARLKINVTGFYKNVILKMIPSLLITLIFGIMLEKILPAGGITALGIKVILTVFVFAMAAYYLYLTNEERTKVLEKFKSYKSA